MLFWFFLLFFIFFGLMVWYYYEEESSSHKKFSDWGRSGNWQNKLDQMNGYEFEEFIAELFSNMGYRTRVTKKSGDQGVDVIAKGSNSTLAIQAKCYSNKKVSNSAVQAVFTGKAMFEADESMIVTNSEFTESAIELARANNVKLKNREDLLNLIDSHM